MTENIHLKIDESKEWFIDEGIQEKNRVDVEKMSQGGELHR